jgi:hypothetical protein
MNTESIRTEIKKLSVESHDILLRIITLKWGSLENSRRAGEIKASRTPEGAPARRAEVKKLRHPETGAERAALWAQKRELKDQIRHHLLAYAFARGRSYASQEAKCTSAPSLSWIETILTAAGGSVSVDALKAWVTPTTEPVAAEVAA